LQHRERRRIGNLTKASLIAATTLTHAGASGCAAQAAEPKVQPPWAYTFRFDDAHEVEFMATTPAADEVGVWLLLACDGREQLHLSIVHSSQFPFALAGISRIMLRLDDWEPVALPVETVEQKLVMADPQPAKDLLPLLAHSSKLMASIAEPNGAVHSYTFALQPNDLALRDIKAHCPIAPP
jgi:hypothetical protein